MPATQLKGRRLDGGWDVIEKMTRDRNSTGGRFSVGYRVRHQDGREAFLKALDFSAASQSSDVPRDLKALLDAFVYERDLLEKCKTKKLRRVMLPILDGKVSVPGYGFLGDVYYLIFELADGDIRNVSGNYSAFDLAWCMRSLHNVSVAVRQLHTAGIVHQDLKPSNVLVIRKLESKIGDLGRASDQDKASPTDQHQIAGDRAYAPIDLYYDIPGHSGFEKRLMTDLYLLGSLIFFHFSSLSAVQALRTKLSGMHLDKASFSRDLPHIQHAFLETLKDLETSVQALAGDLTHEIIAIARQLCEPDPSKRGDPKWHGSRMNYNLETYISRFERLARTAEYRMR